MFACINHWGNSSTCALNAVPNQAAPPPRQSAAAAELAVMAAELAVHFGVGHWPLAGSSPAAVIAVPIHSLTPVLVRPPLHK